MNDRSRQTFAAEGGEALLGANILDCHPEPARGKLAQMMETGSSNVYTIEKNGQKKLIYQVPWYDEAGQYAGFIELSLEIPIEMSHFVRG